jgi:hypothetical protein
MKNEIATPFGLAMTTWGVKTFNAFVLVLVIRTLDNSNLFGAWDLVTGV